jgi:hypothetical protein
MSSVQTDFTDKFTLVHQDSRLLVSLKDIANANSSTRTENKEATFDSTFICIERQCALSLTI